jgi:hypothetical protein
MDGLERELAQMADRVRGHDDGARARGEVPIRWEDIDVRGRVWLLRHLQTLRNDYTRDLWRRDGCEDTIVAAERLLLGLSPGAEGAPG